MIIAQHQNYQNRSNRRTVLEEPDCMPFIPGRGTQQVSLTGVSAQAHIWVDAPLQKVFAAATTPQTDSSRRLTCSDDSMLEETVVTLIPALRAVYRITPRLRWPLSLVAGSGESVWSFTPGQQGTYIFWKVELEARIPLFAPVLGLFFRFFFTRAQAACLRRIKAGLEGG